MKNKNVKILSIEGKDLLLKQYTVNENTIYKASLDDSIEVDKLKTLSKKFIQYDKESERYYTNEIITVTFNYASKCDEEFDEVQTERLDSLNHTISLLINDKYRLRNTINKNSTEEEISIINKQIKNIDKQIKETKDIINMVTKSLDKKDIRNQLYQYGFNITINGERKHFVRYKRSSGSARVGKCLFINEKYKKKMIKWSFAGLPHKEGQEMDCASMESYISLPTSSCVNSGVSRFNLKPENILLIEDGTSTFKDTVMATRLINEEYDKDGNIIGGDLDTNVEETEITNKVWDGSSLLDKSIFEECGYGDKAILQMRKRMFKGIGINTDIQQFFKDNNITKISQLNGKTIATDISQIKLITTPSSIKYLKFGTFEQWLKQIENDGEWGICKYEKPQHHFGGMVQTHYQLLNTLGMSKNTMREFLDDTISYINLLKEDVSVFKYHLGLDGQKTKDELRTNVDSKSSFAMGILDINNDFIKTKMGKNLQDDTIKSYIKNVRKGHVLVEGNYSVVISSPYEYLLTSIGKWDGKSSIIKPHECVTSKFNKGEEIVGVRSPQPTMCNMTVFKNNKYEVLDKYFNTNSKEVIYISAIGWNIFELESSMDVDGDTMMITNNKYIVDSAKKLNEEIVIDDKKIKRFLVSTDFTPKSSIKRKYNWKDLADTDIKCSSNKIGEIINMAQMLNSVYWNKKYNGASEEELFELYKDICQLNILSCIEIDRCKKLSPVNATKELNKIREKGYLGKGTISRNKIEKEVGIRPYFFKFLDGGKDYKFKKFHTGMDYLEEIIDKEINVKNYETDIPLSSILISEKASKADRRKIERIIKIVTEMKNAQNQIYNMQDCDNKWELIQDNYNYNMKRLRKIYITSVMIYAIIKRIDDAYNNENSKFKEYKPISRKLLNTLFDYNHEYFLQNIKIKKNNIYIIEDKDGDIKLYNKKFKKIG